MFPQNAADFYAACHRDVGDIDKRQIVGLGSHKDPGTQ